MTWRAIVVALLAKFTRCESGETALEYGLIIGMISVTVIGFAPSVGATLSGTFSKVKSNLG